jgi:high affinity Mn2+ porin
MCRTAAGATLAILLQAGAAAAADAAAHPPMFGWAGFYFGGDLGAGIPRSTSEKLQAVSGFAGSPFDLDPPTQTGSGFTFGAHVGYNWQKENLVYGVETEFNFLNSRQGPNGIFAAPPAYGALGIGSYSISSAPSGSYMGMLRARVGVAQDRTLYYISGGVATGGWSGASSVLLQGGNFGSFFTSSISDSQRMKYAVGAGVERYLGANWSLRGEYLFVNQSFNTQVLGNGLGFAYQTQKYNDMHVLRLGLSYHLENKEPLAGEEESKKTKKGKDTSKTKSRSEDIESDKDKAQAKGEKASGKGNAQEDAGSNDDKEAASDKDKDNEAGDHEDMSRDKVKGEDKKGKDKSQGKKKREDKESEKDKDESKEPETYSVHGQVTLLPQGYPGFRALYSGPNSLKPPGGQARATLSSTAYLGVRLWDGGEAYVNPEIDDGYGLSSTFGVAGFPSTEAFKVGRAAPYERFHKYFFRQTIGLGGESEPIESGANVLAGSVDANRLTFTIGKYAVPDIFDDNRYAHDGRSGFLNWTINEMGAFDYAADAWGYTNGAAAEWKQDWWTARGGLFQLSRVPNGQQIEPTLFRQFSQVVELEARHRLLFGQEGKIKLLGFGDLGYIGKYQDALETAFLAGATPDITLDRKKRFKAGGGVNIEQPITDDLGFFLRASMANGRYETIEFTEVERSLSAGFVLAGTQWGRPKDAIGLGGVVNGISNAHAAYLAAGGLGFIIGDGALNYDGEHILETYYRYNLMDGVHVTGDYQFIDNPGYNRDRGPVSVFALRLHAEF